VKKTSVEAYKSILESGLLTKSCRLVARALADVGPTTGNDLDRYLTNPSAHKRLADLARMGVAEVVGEKKDPVTGKYGEVWALKANAVPVKVQKAASKKAAPVQEAPKPAPVPQEAPKEPEASKEASPEPEALQAALARLRQAQEDVRDVLGEAMKARSPLTATQRAVERLLRAG
jgi:hypothetical protein